MHVSSVASQGDLRYGPEVRICCPSGACLRPAARRPLLSLLSAVCCPAAGAGAWLPNDVGPTLTAIDESHTH
eukprot:COSAG01_NODE_28839_length_651_cov_2.211957_1_plen_71_part_01